MPIECQIPMRPMDREQFGRVSYDVVHDLIEVHNEMGRFFDESIYKRALAAMRNDLLSEVVAPKVAFKLTALEDSDAQDRFLEHVQRLVNHVDLEALLWVNIGYHRVTFRTVMAQR